MRIIEITDQWIFRTYAPCTKGLPLFRILFSLYLSVFYLPRYAWVGTLPASFFRPPPGLAALFTGFPPSGLLYALDFFLAVGAVCLLFGYRTRFVSFAVMAGILLGNSFRYSVGTKIDHDILVPITLFCLGFSGWGNRLSQDEGRGDRATERTWAHSPAWPIALLVLMTSVCMFTAVLPKISSGWADPHLEASRGHMILHALHNGAPSSLAASLFQIRSPLFWKGADWGTLIVEGGFLFCVFSLPAIRLVACLAVIFHVLVFFTMDICFLYNIVAYACLMDHRRLLRGLRLRRWLARFGRFAHRVPLFAIIAMASVLFAVTELLHAGDFDYLRWANTSAMIGALVVATGSLFHLVKAFTWHFLPQRMEIPESTLANNE